MRNSKALKGWFNKHEHWWYGSKIYDIYHSIKRAIVRPFERAKLMYDWYVNVFHNDFDWESHFLYKIMEYKLVRIEKALKEGVAVQEEKDMKALRLAIKILRRMQNEHQTYFEKAHRDHDLKWGELITWTTPNQDDLDKNGEVRTYRWHSRRPNANTPEEIEQERQEYRLVWAKEAWLQERDKKWLYGILQKYMDAWWD